jgi:predicted nuclease of predicted toxin-antitoxin system
MKIVIDESISYGVVSLLRDEGHSVIAVAEQPTSGSEDEAIFEIVRKEKAILITRDHHFTNNLRYPPQYTAGIIFLRKGNFKSDQEINLIKNFLTKFAIQDFEGKLVTLDPGSVKIRS